MYKIYLDIDNTVSDIPKHFENLFGMDSWEYAKKYGKDKFWEALYSKPDFFRHIPLYDYSLEFYNKIATVFPHTIFLSAPSKKNVEESIRDKYLWVRDHFVSPLTGSTAHVIVEEKKYIYADESSILVDDTQKNCDAFAGYGGISILHDPYNPWASIDALENITNESLY